MNLLTVKEAAAYLRMPPPTVYYLVKEEKIKAIRVGGRLRIDRDYLDEHILKITQRPKEEPTVVPSEVTRILIVDPHPQDNAIPLHLAAKIQFDLAPTAARSWQLLTQIPYDIIILDADIEDTSLDAFYQKVRLQCPKASLIVTTPSMQRPEIGPILAKGPATFMTKPWRVDQLPTARWPFQPAEVDQGAPLASAASILR